MAAVARAPAAGALAAFRAEAGDLRKFAALNYVAVIKVRTRPEPEMCGRQCALCAAGAG